MISGRPEQFDDHFLGLANGFRIGADNHIGRHRHTAGCGKRSGAFHFDHAYAAGTDIGCFGI
jgi:hypothetical protein